MDRFISRSRVRAARLGLAAAGARLDRDGREREPRRRRARRRRRRPCKRAAQQPAHVQADESASLRQGTIGAVDARAGRVQVQGIWLDARRRQDAAAAQRPSRRRSRRSTAGEAIRFTVVAAAPVRRRR